MLPAAERAWEVEVDQMGWPPPAGDGDLCGDTDRFDLYLTNEDTYGGAWTWGPLQDVVSDDGWYSVAAFIALDEREITSADMPDFVAHEFNHALHFTIDGWETTIFVWESTANAMEELVVPDSNLYVLDIPYFNALPFESLLFDGYTDEVTEYDPWSTYEYGGAITGLYLEHAFGSDDGTTLLQLWLDLAQGSADDEPDYIDALDAIGGDIAPTYQDVYLGIAEWRMFIADDDDGAHYPEASEWGRSSKVATEGQLNLSEIDGTAVTPVDAPYDLGTSYWVISVDDDTGGSLHLEARHPRNTFTLSFRRDAAVVDADDTGSTEVPSPQKQEEASGCGCSTGSGSSLGLVALTLLASRRRRVQIDRAAPFTVHGRAPPPVPPEPNGSRVSPPRPHRLHHGH